MKNFKYFRAYPLDYHAYFIGAYKNKKKSLEA